MPTLLCKRKPEVPKSIDSRRGCFLSCLTKLVYPLPTVLFFMILMLVWSSSTTHISSNIVHVCVSSRKLSNLYCLSPTTDQPKVEFHLSFTNSTSQAFLEKGILVLEEKLKKQIGSSIPVLNDKSVNLNLRGDSKEVPNTVVENSVNLVKGSSKDVPTVVVDKSTIFLEKRVGNADLEGDSEEGSGVVLENPNPQKVGSTTRIRRSREWSGETKKAWKVADAELLVQRSWMNNQNQNEKKSCDERGIYVYELPPKFNKELAAQCHNMVRWLHMCKYFSNNALGEPIPELGNRWFQTHQYSLELIFHTRVLNHPCRVYNESEGKLFYVPYYGGLDILRWHFKNVTNEIKDSLSVELVTWLKMQKPWNKNLGKDHFFVLGKISWDFRRKENSSWGTRFLELDEIKNPIKLMIERNAWDVNEIGIPHPTHFHPHSDFDILSWQRVIISSHRRSLVSFVGAARPMDEKNIRSVLIDQCTSTSEEHCKFLDCKSGLCANPKTLIRLFMESEFCLQPPGDSPTRKSVFDSLVSGCIPVVFNPLTTYYQYPWHLPEDYEMYSVFVDQEEVREMKVNVVERLMKVPLKERDDMRRYIVYELMPKLVYGDADANFELFQDAFSITVNNLIERVRRLNLE